MLQPSKEDRRIIRSRKVITEAFVSLLRVKGFPDISVADLTEHAEINRSTFYAHYKDKFDLLHAVIEEKLTLLSEELEASRVSHSVLSNTIDSPHPYFVTLFDHLQTHAGFYTIMFKRIEDNAVRSRMLEVIRESQFIIISHFKLEQKMLIPMDVLLDYLCSSIIGVVEKWYDNGVKYSANYMALQLTRISMLGTDKAMGL
ncbi:TetR/AcrR family transcriptional regulator [Paenibacillus sp. MCAF9]|uniref:TetR/AcrR family transcriptional regulator n=1 Tax=Paenibacillus sp. MCAF9 TaxID=3233046 RepID=UPI003F99E543